MILKKIEKINETKSVLFKRQQKLTNHIARLNLKTQKKKKQMKRRNYN